MKENICVVGTGYVGIACSIGLATLGWSVVGYDLHTERIERLKIGIAPYRELGLEEALRTQMYSGRLRFCESLEASASFASLIIIAVGTPSGENGSADLSALWACIEALARLTYDVRPTLVLRSTVPPGTADELALLVESWADVLSAPEFLREGSAVPDFLSPDRIIVGAASEAAARPYVSLFEALRAPVLVTSHCNAELIKGCSNAFLALKISFANEVANLCDAVGGLSDDVLRGIGYDKRIGKDFLRPGIGFGGPCFEKDVKSMEYVSAQAGSPNQLFSAILRVNEAQPRRILELLEDALGDLAGQHIGVWGLAFKAGTDDVRDSLAVRIVGELSRRGASTTIYDPAVHLAELPPKSQLTAHVLKAAEADALLVLTEWPEFALVPPAEVATRLRRGVVIDGRNVLDGARYAAAGLYYHGVGRSQHAVSAEDTSYSEARAV